MIEVEIDGKKCLAEPGQMIIDVADANDIYIPRFCYHRKLSIAANCRMCLVQVEKMGKPMPACATPVTDGTKVFTKSKMAIEAQKSVMEFLLINHPLDCPICDQAGECELQDLSVGFGSDVSRYTEGKRSVDDEDLGPLISTEMTRCIHCTRCVRFGQELAGLPELGATGRGETMRIETFVRNSLKSEVSGNIIDLCPVGALTNKPYRFRGRSWELSQHAMIAAHDCVGSNIYVHTKGQEYSEYREVLRVVPRDHEEVNENWISDRDRYSCEALSSQDRLTSPMIKQGGSWKKVDWSTALNLVVDKLQDIQGTDIAGLASPNATCEELYLFQKWLRGIGCPNIDHRLRQTDFSQQDALPHHPSMNMGMADCDNLQAILFVGSDVRREQPIANLRIRKAVMEHGNAYAINPRAYDFNFPVEQRVVHQNEMMIALATVAQAVAQIANKSLDDNVAKLAGTVGEFESSVAQALCSTPTACVMLGAAAQNHPQAHTLQAIANLIAQLAQARVSVMSEGANATGAWLAGVLPHRGPAADKPEKTGVNARDMFSKQHKAYVLLHTEPELDCADSKTAHTALNNADFVVCMTPFMGGDKENYADVLLPVAGFAQTFGTYVNGEGRWQSFQSAGTAYENARPAWKIFRVLGNLFNLDGFDFDSPDDVLYELKSLTTELPAIKTELNVEPAIASAPDDALIVEWPMYCVDPVVRRSIPLQQTLDDNVAVFRMNDNSMKKYGVQQGEVITVSQGEVGLTLPVINDNSLPNNSVHVYAGLEQTAAFGDVRKQIMIERSNEQ